MVPTKFSEMGAIANGAKQLAPSWILSWAGNLASSSLQDGATMWHYSHETTHPPLTHLINLDDILDIHPCNNRPRDICPGDICSVDICPGDICPSDICPWSWLCSNLDFQLGLKSGKFQLVIMSSVVILALLVSLDGALLCKACLELPWHFYYAS